MNYKITKIEEKDINTIYNLGCSINKYTGDGGKNCFWPKKTLLDLFKSENDITLKISINNQIIGFCLTMIHPVTKKAIIENLFILPEYQELTYNFLKIIENQIKLKNGQFIAYYFENKNDPIPIELFEKSNYYIGEQRQWLHKNICFSNPKPKK